MTDTSQPRKPSGTPTGGEFAAKAGSAPASALSKSGPPQRQVDWFAERFSEASELAEVGLIAFDVNGTCDGEPIIRYQTPSGVAIDMYVDDLGGESDVRFRPVDVTPEQVEEAFIAAGRRLSVTNGGAQNGAGVFRGDGGLLVSDLAVYGVDADDDNTYEVLVDASKEMAWAVGHWERDIGQRSVKDERGF